MLHRVENTDKEQQRESCLRYEMGNTTREIELVLK